MGNDGVVRYHGHFYQLQDSIREHAPVQSKVLVCEGRHGAIAIEYRGRELRFREIAAPVKPARQVKWSELQRRAVAANVRHKAADNHPWKQAAREAAARKALQEAGLTRSPSLTWPCTSP
ncbi:MAG: hypothetical protein WBQ34_05570 [Candidatus Acidiferrales bacterium]